MNEVDLALKAQLFLTPRSTTMSLMNEALARAHCREQLSFAEHERNVRRHVKAARMQRKAERASRLAARADDRAKRLAAKARLTALRLG